MKKRIFHFVGTQVVRVLSIAVMVGLFAASAMYLRGYYDLTFVDRVPLTPPADSSGTTADTDAPTTDAPETDDIAGDETDAPDTEPVGSDTAEPPNNQQEQKPDGGQQTQKPDKKETASSVLAALKKSKALSSAGYKNQMTGIYTAGKTLLANLSISGFGKKYTFSTYEARTTVTTEYERGCIYTEEVFETTDRPAVLLRNGYIIRDVNGKLSLLKPDGTTLLSDYDESKFRLTELRDKNGNPLFAAVKYEKREVQVPVMQKNEFTGRLEETGEYLPETVTETVAVYTYYTLSSDGKWVVSDYTDEYPHAEADMGLSFDAPQDYGQSDCDIVRYYDYGSWGYKNAKTGQIVVYPRFIKAYNFNDGYAVAFDWYGMHFLNEKGQTVYSVNYDKPEVFATYNEVTLPDTNGIEAIGTYYFSHGLTRVRFRENLETYQTWYYIKSDDRSVLYDIHGNEYPLPFGYTLCGYSDGVMLLQNNETGLYGCMNYKNEWIVQPECPYASPCLSGLIAVKNAKGKMGLVDTEGNWVLPQVFDYVSAPSSGMVAVYDSTTGWQVLRMMSK